MTLLRSIAIGLLILLCAGSAILLVTHEGRVAIRTAMLIPEVTPGSSFRPLTAISEPPVTGVLQYPYTGGVAQGTLYRPAGPGQHGALIITLGVHPDVDDAGLRQFAQAVSRQGAVVLLLDGIDDGRVALREVDALVAAFRWLQTQSYVNPKRMGFMGFCVGGSMALLAASDPRIAGDVRFVNDFGGFFSAESLLEAMTTRSIPAENPLLPPVPWQPHADAYRWFIDSVIAAAPDAADRETLRVLSRRDFAIAPAERALFTLTVRVVVDLLANRDPDAVPELYEQLPPALRSQLAAISPDRAFDWLTAKVFVMHDRNDTYVPVSESRRLNQALAAYPRRVYTEFASFEHVVPASSFGSFASLPELAKLYYHMYLVLLELS